MPINCFAPSLHQTAAGVVGAVDDFDRTDEAIIAPPWISRFGILLLSNDRIVAANRFIDNIAEYDGGIAWRDNHRSTVTLSAVGYNHLHKTGPAVRVGFAGAYVVGAWKAGTQVLKITATGGSARTVLASDATAWIDGDRCELRITGSTLRVFKNGTEIVGLQCTDGGLTTGRPGIYVERGPYAPPSSNLVIPGLGAPALSGLSPRIRLPRTALPGLSQLAMAGVPPLIVNAPAGFLTPDIINNASFETNFDGMTNGGFTTPGPLVTRSNIRAQSGTFSVRRQILTTGDDDGGVDAPFYAGSPQFAWTPSPAVAAQTFDRLWTRLYFYLVAATNASHKFHQLFGPSYGVQFAGLQFHVSGLLMIGGPEDNGTGAGAISVGSTTDAQLDPTSGLTGAWHCLEMDYWRNGDTSNGGHDYPSIAAWLDGVPYSGFRNGTPHGPASWITVAGVPRLNFGQRASTTKIGVAHFIGVVNNGATIGSDLFIDRIGVSSRGRIGP